MENVEMPVSVNTREERHLSAEDETSVPRVPSELALSTVASAPVSRQQPGKQLIDMKETSKTKRFT